jgi:hypothetical protein
LIKKDNQQNVKNKRSIFLYKKKLVSIKQLKKTLIRKLIILTSEVNLTINLLTINICNKKNKSILQRRLRKVDLDYERSKDPNLPLI